MTLQLEDILASRLSTPWTYVSFVAYLSDNYCLEVLQFTLAAAQYKERYDLLLNKNGERVTESSEESQELMSAWTSLVETYLLPDAEREVNLPCQIRDPIIRHGLEERAPPDPQILELAILATWEMMEGLILSSFLREVSPQLCSPEVPGLLFHADRPFIHVETRGSRRARVVNIMHSARPRAHRMFVPLLDIFARHHHAHSRGCT